MPKPERPSPRLAGPYRRSLISITWRRSRSSCSHGEQAVKWLTRLIDEYPRSDLLPDAWMMLGEHWFTVDFAKARTAPPGIATMLGRGGIEWSAIAAGALGFLIPVIIVVFVLRKHLLRGVTFGAIRQ